MPSESGKAERIVRTEYSELMKKSYIDYAMSVIVARALPDVRDGLKPVQRRTLYDMYELGIRYDKPYRKCARIVGDTMGKYHPHGDSSIYEALVVMAQDFKKGKTLVDGHGNFGSIEGDGAAAMRYTEARLTRFAQEAFLSDLDKDVVDFVPNFDETEREPKVLPARLPNLLINGAEGIAVGMAVSVPPHNLGEVIDALKAYMKNPDITVKELMRYVKGPDFPTGGIVVNQDELLQIYETGTGKIKVRAKAKTEEEKGGRKRLVISELPYPMIGAGIGRFLNDVCALVEARKITDITDISNQSSKEGIRIVLELKKGADVQNLTNMLYKKTRLEDTFGVNMLAVAKGRPETMGLKRLLACHAEFHLEVTSRKYRNLLEKEQEKREIQEGLIRACEVIDLIIEILRGSRSMKDAKECLIKGETENIKFKSGISKKMAAMLRFTERQAGAILDMRLYKLIGLEVEALIKEQEKTLKNIEEYEEILGNPQAMAKVVIRELDDFKKRFGEKRKTQIENAQEAVFEETGGEEEIVFLMDRFGYARTISALAYERNKEAADSESRYVIPCMSAGKICLFTNTGKLHQIRLCDLPFGKFREKGQPADNVSNYDSTKEEIVFLCDAEELRLSRLFFATKQGFVKLVAGEEFLAAKKTVAAAKLQEGDELVSVQILGENQYIALQTKEGYFLKFGAQEVPQVKKSAVGVRGIRLREGDSLTKAYLCTEGEEYRARCKEGEVNLQRLRMGKRDTKGVKSKG